MVQTPWMRDLFEVRALKNSWAGDVDQQLKALAILAEDLSLFPSTHVAAHSRL